MNRIARISKKAARVAAAFVAAAAIALAPMTPLAAAVNWKEPAAKVSFTFDDSDASVYNLVKPTLDQYGLKGTSYVITGCIGMTTAPNTCRANNDTAYMTWSQVEQLAAEGWDIGSHTVTHPYLATSDASDGQPNVLTPAQVEQELSQSKAALAAHGIDATSFASPYGDYNNSVLASIARYYESQRGFQDIDNNVWSYNDYIINDMPVQAGVSVADVKARIDAAIANNHWLVLTFHDIKTNASNKPEDYEYSVSNLNQIAAYVKSKIDANQLKAPTVKNGIVKSDVNLFTNGGFTDGFNTWTTNAPTNIKYDGANNGSYPNPANAVSIKGGSSNQSLFSQQVSVDSTQTYMFKSFMNLKAISSGELGWYIDEYNNTGDWISGRWITARYNASVQNVNFTYKPTSSNVKKASLQVYTTANSGITAYMDNFQFFPLVSSNTPAPTMTNLLPSGDFTSGLSTGWSTNNSAAFTPENGQIKLTSKTSASSLFAPALTVDPATTYTVKAGLNIATMTSGEVAFYIDEYTTAGQWISGQYAYAKRSAGNETISFDYKPSSTNVKKASVQTILTGNSGITGYLDNLQFLAPGTVVVTPPVEPTNMVANGTFDAGLANGWTTNSASITADSGNNGSPANATNSIKMVATAQERHLFGPQISVSSANSYNVTTWLNITARTGGAIAFYIDEYDANGNWISGQYKSEVTATGAGDRSLTYQPSSANVAKASLQVIISANSGITAYVDNVRWYQN
ncbi:MAG TPA: polysaccharide deacetylase family protein [Candidatus Saccharimonadales bacterium]|nr:polysaccharide deacetylase family protein [Candidatus Saccharimonadales bacterium]